MAEKLTDNEIIGAFAKKYLGQDGINAAGTGLHKKRSA